MDVNFNSLVEEQKEPCDVRFACAENNSDVIGDSEDNRKCKINSSFEDSRAADQHSLEKLAELTAAMNRFGLDINSGENPARSRSNSEPMMCPYRSPKTIFVTSCDRINENFAVQPVHPSNYVDFSAGVTPPTATSEQRRRHEWLPSRTIVDVSNISYEGRHGLYRHTQEQFRGKLMIDSNTPNGDVSSGYVWSGEVPLRNYSNPTFSSKIFVGGVPWDITETPLLDAFSPYGKCRVVWPSKEVHSRSNLGNRGKVTGYVYILFETERSVKSLLQDCSQEFGSAGEWYFKLKARRSYTSEIRQVQIIPWVISDSSYIGDPDCRLDPSKTVFVGALHGMITAHVLFSIMNDLYDNVVFAGIDTDKHKYPIGSGRVTFRSYSSYLRAVDSAFVEIRTSKFCKKVQIDPFLEDSLCLICYQKHGPYFCRDRTCFRYYCGTCWQAHHRTSSSFGHHRPLTRNAPRFMSLRTGNHDRNVGPHNLPNCQPYPPAPGRMPETPLSGVAAIAAIARGTVLPRQQHNTFHCTPISRAYSAALYNSDMMQPRCHVSSTNFISGIKDENPASNLSYFERRLY